MGERRSDARRQGDDGPPPPTRLSTRVLGRLLCLVGGGLGLLGLFGWIFELSSLRTIVPGQPAMKPNTAVGLLLLGAAGALRCREGTSGLRRALILVAAVVALAIGVTTGLEYVFGVELNVDELLFEDVAEPFAGRPSPPTAMAIALLAAAILTFNARPNARVRAPEWFSISAGFIGLTAMLGQIFGAGPLYHFEAEAVTGVAVPTALAIILLATGLLLERPGRGIMSVYASAGPGGVLLRRLSVAAFLGPVLLSFLLIHLLSVIGVEELPLVYATLVSATVVVGLLLLTLTSGALERTHTALDASRARIRELVQQASDAIFTLDLDGRYTDTNEAGCRLLGRERDEIIGKPVTDMMPLAEREQLPAHRERLLTGHTEVGEWTVCRKDGTLVAVEVSAKILLDGRWQAILRDMTDRKKAAEVIRQSKERFELALRGADLGAWDWDIKTGNVVFNARWAEMRGYLSDEIRPHVATWSEGVHPDDRLRVERALADHFAGRTPEYEAEHRVRTKTGEWIWVLDRGRVFSRDERGRPLRMVGTELEITTRKRMDEALRLSEAKLSGMVTTSADAIIAVDEDERITLFNRGAEEIFGYAKDEVVGASLDVLIPERFRKEHRRHVEQFSAGTVTSRRTASRSRVVGRRKSGDEFPAEAAISKVDVAGVRQYTVILRDVTEEVRRESEKEFLAEVGATLAESLDYEQTLGRIAELSVRKLADVCILEVVTETGEVQPMKVLAKEAGKAALAEEYIRIRSDRSKPFLALEALQTRRPVLLDRISPAILASLAQSSEHLRVLRALDPRSLIAVPLVSRDTLLGAVTLMSTDPSRTYTPHDLRLAVELGQRAALSVENARLYRAAQRAIQARDDVLGVVAHDLRNPLGVITMQATLLGRNVSSSDPALRRAYETIGRGAKRMNRLIEDLLDISRIEAGRLSVEQAPVSLAKVIADSADAQEMLVKSASLDLRLDVAPVLPDVLADRDRLLQVLENLIGNAVKFTPAGGSITVGAAPRNHEVVLWVADTGPGISPDDVPHLFDRFWQARTGCRRGAGLGLPIVKGIVEAHGGRVWVDTEPGRGSTFYISLPCPVAAPVVGASAA